MFCAGVRICSGSKVPDSEDQPVRLEGMLERKVIGRSGSRPFTHQFSQQYSPARDSAGHRTYEDGKVIFLEEMERETGMQTVKA